MWVQVKPLFESVNSDKLIWQIRNENNRSETEIYFENEDAMLGVMRRNFADKLNGKKNK